MAARGIRGLGSRNTAMRIGRKPSVIGNDENSITHVKINPLLMKNKTNVKRKADATIDEKPAKKRSAFGDITNAIEKTFKEQKKEGLKIKPPAQKNKGNSFKVLGRKPIKQKENDENKSLLINNIKKDVPTANKKRVSDRLKNKQVEKPSDDASFCDSLLSSQGLVVPSKSFLNDTSTYLTASEGSPIAKQSLMKSLSKSKTKIKKTLPPGVADYDDECKDDVFAVATYALDIFKYYKERESCFPVEKYMTRQSQITKTMRSILVDWMVEVQESFELNHETLYLAVKLVDYYLTKVVITRDILQLVGSTSLFIACKFDERIPPYADDFLFICDNAYKKRQLFQMEIKMLKAIGYDLGIPLSYRFLRRYARCCKLSMDNLTLARYILERSLMEYDLIDASDSALAAAALLLSRAIKKDPTWPPVLQHYSGYKMEDIFDLAHVLHSMLLNADDDKSQTIKTKYSHKVFFEVATIPIPEDLGL